MKLSELVNAVVTNTNRRDKTSLIKQAVNDAIRRSVQQSSWRFLVRQVDLGIVAGDFSVSLPALGTTTTDVNGDTVKVDGIAQIRTIQLLDSTNTSMCQIVELLTQTEVQNRWPNLMRNSTGRPKVCYRQGDELVFLPPSSGVYTLRVTYDAQPTDLTSDNDESPSQLLDDAIICFATARVYQSIQMYTDGSQFMNEYQQALKAAALADRRTAGRNPTLGSTMPVVDSGDPYENKFTRT